MAVSNILNSFKDLRKDGTDCDFNGYLEDYIEIVEDAQLKSLFEKIFDIDPDCKICVNYRSEINRQAISNQIIRYKDAFKLQGKPIVYPYILYTAKDDQERALLLVPKQGKTYLYAKGFYFCMTEPYSVFQDYRNEIVAIGIENEEEVISAFNKLFTMRAGALQREIDRTSYSDYEQLQSDAIAEATRIKDGVIEELQALEDKQEKIIETVAKWFLLKKISYVQYMVNKDILLRNHEGNVKKQRNQAKLNSDEIPFMSYSELWRCTGDNKAKAEEVVEE